MSDINLINAESQRTFDIQKKKTVLEINYVLPDNRPRIVSVEDSNVNVGVSGVSLSGDIAEFNIFAQVDLIYNALAVSEDEEHLFCTACRFSKTFKETSDIAKEDSSDEIRAYALKANVENVETTLISDRKVNIKIYVLLYSAANIYYNENCADSFEDHDIVCKKKIVSGVRSLGLKRVESYINEDVELDKSLPEIENILCKNVSIQIENKKITDGKIIFYGTAHTDIVFSANTDEEKFFSAGFDVNFNQACEFDGLNDDTQSVIDCSVSDVTLDVKSNGIIGTEMLLSFEVEAFGNYEYDVIEDAFLPGANTQIDKCELRLANNIIINENVGICSEKLNVASGDADKILASSVQQHECNTYIKEKNVYFDGVYNIKVMYVPKTDSNLVKIVTAQVPFGYMAQAQVASADVIDGNVSVKSVTAQINDYGEIIVKWVADVQALVTQIKYVNALNNIHREDEKSTKERSIYYHFISENETVWDVAKKFGVAPSDLCKLNNITEDSTIDNLKGLVIVVNRG